MSIQSKPARSKVQQEEGFLLLGVLFMILVIMITLALAAPKVADSIRRDKEEETIHRGKQYARAIQIFYNKTGRYPNSIDELMKTQNQRFLRKRYLNPMTGKDDWRLIHYGEAKVPAQGLFGQSVQQTGGITPTGAGSTGTSVASIGGSGSSSSSPFGSSGSSGSGSSLGSSGAGFGSSGSSFSSGSSTSPFGSSSAPSIGGTNSGSGSGFGSSTGIGGTTATGSNGTSTAIGGTQTTGSSGAFGSPGVSVGGAPIVGVGLLSKNTSIKIYKKQAHYNQWEFVFDPNQNSVAVASTPINGSNNGTTGAAGTGFGATPGSGSGLGSGTGTGSGFGSSTGSGFGSSTGSGFGSSTGSGFGGSPTSPVSPTMPNNNSPQ